MDKKVSIVTTSYNYQEYIKKTIESVINQTFQEWEMIIVDDGSKDNSVAVIQEYCEKDNRIKLYTHPNNENKGLSATIQYGIKKSNTDWIIFLESDDTIAPNYIEEKLKIIEQYPNVKFIYNDINMFGDKKRIEMFNRKYFSKFYNIVRSKKYPCNMLCEFKKINIVPTFSCVMLNKEILNNLDWDIKHKPLLDYYLWTQLALNYDFFFIDKKLTNWRVHKGSYIQKNENNLQEAYSFYIQIPNIIIKKHKHSFLFRYINIIKFLIKCIYRI